MTNERSPREVRADDELRKLSKSLFNSQYRIEVALAIDRLHDDWTIDYLAKLLNDVPRSSVVKEVKALIALRVVKRGSEALIAGAVPYRSGDGLPSFWALVKEAYQQCDDVPNLLVLPGSGTETQ